MKITDILVEGVRFGNREKRMVERFSNDVLLGFEFEFMVEDGASNLDLDSVVDVIIDEEIERKARDIVYEIGAGAYETAYDIAQEMKRIFIEHYIALDDYDYKKFIALAKEILELKDDVDYLRDVYLTGMEYVVGIYIYFGELFEILDEIKTSLEEVESLDIETEDDKQSVIDELYNPIDRFMDEAKYVANNLHTSRFPSETEQLIAVISDAIKEDSELFYISFGMSYDEYRAELATEPEVFERLSKDASIWADRMIEEANIDGHYSNDPSVDVEVVHEKERFKDAIETLKRGLKWMRDTEEVYTIGNETQGTGLHCNVSIRNERFTKDNIDRFKLMLLMQERRIDKHFDTRKHVESMFDVLMRRIGRQHWYEILENLRDPEAISNIFEDLIPYDKYQRINFNHLIEDMDTRRIEFRFPGGEDYEYKEKEIIDWCYRMVYMTMAAYSEDFGRKEYMQEMVKFLDKMAKAHYSMSLDELIKMYREEGDIPLPRYVA